MVANLTSSGVVCASCSRTRWASLPKFLRTDNQSARCCLKIFHTSTRIFHRCLTVYRQVMRLMLANDPGGKILRGHSGNITHGIGIFRTFGNNLCNMNQPGKRTGSNVIGILGHTFNAITEKPLSSFVSKHLLRFNQALRERVYQGVRSDQSAGRQRAQ